MSNTDEILKEAKRVLHQNDAGEWTIPAKDVYPHQWLWDSCFIAIGLRHFEPERAVQELQSVVRGQWSNGMIPHMTFTPQPKRIDDSHLWRSKIAEHAPKNLATSGITQPPVLATAVLSVSEKLDKRQSKTFLNEMYTKLVAYHQWLYHERDINNTGLLAVLHPWETGLDNAPAWLIEMRASHKPHWITLIKSLRLSSLPLAFRRDTKNLSGESRINTITALRYAHAAMALKKRRYDIVEILKDPHFLAYSLSFNCIAIKANRDLEQIAKLLDKQLPKFLEDKFSQAKAGLETLYDTDTNSYSHYSLRTQRFIDQPSISSLLPLYSGSISKKRASELVAQLKKPEFWTKYPVPSVPTNSPHYDEIRFWLGPTWINTNWLLIQGLENYGYKTEAEFLRNRSIELVTMSGMREYFSAKNGEGFGAVDFSWTASLIYDLLS